MSEEINWSEEAEATLKRIPVFVRPMVRKKVEKAAKADGVSEITTEYMNKVKEQG